MGWNQIFSLIIFFHKGQNNPKWSVNHIFLNVEYKSNLVKLAQIRHFCWIFWHSLCNNFNIEIKIQLVVGKNQITRFWPKRVPKMQQIPILLINFFLLNNLPKLKNYPCQSPKNCGMVVRDLRKHNIITCGANKPRLHLTNNYTNDYQASST